MYNNLHSYATETSRQEPSASSASFLSGRGAPLPGPTLQTTASVSNSTQLPGFHTPAERNIEVSPGLTLPSMGVSLSVIIAGCSHSVSDIKPQTTVSVSNSARLPGFYPTAERNSDVSLHLTPLRRAMRVSQSMITKQLIHLISSMDSVPPVRLLAELTSVSVNTVHKAMVQIHGFSSYMDIQTRANQLRRFIPPKKGESPFVYACRMLRIRPYENDLVIREATNYLNITTVRQSLEQQRLEQQQEEEKRVEQLRREFPRLEGESSLAHARRILKRYPNEKSKIIQRVTGCQNVRIAKKQFGLSVRPYKTDAPGE